MRENYNEIYQMTKRAWDKLAKPIDALGDLEELVCRINACQGQYDMKKRPKSALLTFCADHGVVAEGVTQTDSSVTRIVAENLAKGKSSVNFMAQIAGCDVYPVDVGMDCENYPARSIEKGVVIDRKVARGTKNIACISGMTEAEVNEAVNTGKELVKELKSMGYGMIATGEMGIGNTTPSSALTALLCDRTAEEVTGRGAGLDNTAFQNKIKVVERIIERVKKLDNYSSEASMELLKQAGGYEIAAMTGVYLAGYEESIPVVVDGVISAAAALCAVRINDGVRNILIPSHMSQEGAMKYLCEALEICPPVCAGMHLGEGSGCMAVLSLIDMAYSVYGGLSVFEDLNIEQYERFLV